MPFRLIPVLLTTLALLQAQLSFRSGIDVIRLDVSVVDEAGRPVRTLQASDFEVRVDGNARKVSFSKFYGPDENTGPPGTSASSAPAPPVAFASNTDLTAGRLVVFVVDLESIRPGSEKVLLETAGKLISSLGRTDSAGLLPIPGKGVEITRDLNRVREALTALRGFLPATSFRYRLSIDEAEAILRNDSRVVAEVFDRECRSGDKYCATEVREEAKQVIVDAGVRLRTVLTTLTALNQRLEPIDTPKSIVLISGGLGFLRSDMARLLDLERSAAASGTSMYVVQVEQSEASASSGRPSGGVLQRSDLRHGLENIAGATNGEFFSGVGRAVGVFERVQSQMLNSYQLGVESIPRDADGKSHKIEVRIRTPGFTVKARKALIVAKDDGRARTATEILSVPAELAETPIAASAYTLRGDEAGTLMVLMLVESLAGPNGTVTSGKATPTYALTVETAKGVIFNNAAELERGPNDSGRAMMATHLAPGSYRVRAAVVDASGRAGSVDMPVTVGLRNSGPFQTSDLLLGRAGEKFAPASHVAPGTNLSAVIELYASDPELFAGASVDLEVRKAGESDVVARATARIAETELERRRIAEAEIDMKQLPAGTYSVSAIIQKGAGAVGKVSRLITITTP